jgi:hypothetical protein
MAGSGVVESRNAKESTVRLFMEKKRERKETNR